VRKGRLLAIVGGLVLLAVIAGAVSLASYDLRRPEPDLTVTPSESGEGRNITLTLDESVKLKSN
jgi:hypothetical protein